MQFEQAGAAQSLRGALQHGQVGLERGAFEVDPDESPGRHLVGHGFDEAQRAGAEFDDLHAVVRDVRSAQALRSRRAASSAKYVSTPSAPARLKASRLSIMTASWSSQPFCAAALSMAYSPLT